MLDRNVLITRTEFKTKGYGEDKKRVGYVLYGTYLDALSEEEYEVRIEMPLGGEVPTVGDLIALEVVHKEQ